MPEKHRLSDANEAGRPTTPESQLKADVAALSLQATPKSQGSGSYTASGGFTSTRYVPCCRRRDVSLKCALCSVQEVAPWIAHDVKQHDTCTFDAVLIYLLGKVHEDGTPSVPLEKALQAVLPIANSAAVRQGLEE